MERLKATSSECDTFSTAASICAEIFAEIAITCEVTFDLKLNAVSESICWKSFPGKLIPDDQTAYVTPSKTTEAPNEKNGWL
mmetsp:Transcript_2245/g.5130  ORF Transcript_2245/g.5130 Transcript_2245/m.5130 type:complete len:82 (-) Transcript_2245:1413-1658(-)